MATGRCGRLRRLISTYRWAQILRSTFSIGIQTFGAPSWVGPSKRPNKRLELTAPLGGRAGNIGVNAAASRSPFGERRRRSSSAVFDGPLVRMSRTLSKAPTVGAILVAAVGLGDGNWPVS
jgi:hypothetical protein